MVGAIAYAVPVFLAMLVLEALSYRFLPDDEERGYEVRDTATNLSMGVGSLVVGAPWKLVLVVVYAGLYELVPWHLPMGTWWAWALLLFADDLAYYWFHRLHHEVRVLWASHVPHHSSQFYNLSTALRQSWTPMASLPFWLPLALVGFPPWAILLQQSIIVWDRLFASFQPEGERVVYGLTKNIGTFNPVRVAFTEFSDIARDVRSARRWRDRVGYVVRHPGWAPA